MVMNTMLRTMPRTSQSSPILPKSNTNRLAGPEVCLFGYLPPIEARYYLLNFSSDFASPQLGRKTKRGRQNGQQVFFLRVGHNKIDMTRVIIIATCW
jgi:hypothetical protein